MKALSSFDIHCILSELKILEGSKVDKWYQNRDVLYLQVHKTGLGKQLLKILVGQALFLATEKNASSQPSGFGMLLRKHLGNCFLDGIEQIEPERIVKMTFRNKVNTFFIYVEFFGKGNVVLCDEKNTIINALKREAFRDRTIKPKEQYIYPSQQFNYFNLSEQHLGEALDTSKKDSVVLSLATDLGMGGVLAEEICFVAGVDKGEKTTSADVKKLSTALQTVLKKELAPLVTADNSAVYPLQYTHKELKDVQGYDSFSLALEYFSTNEVPSLKTSFDKRVEELQRVVESQRQNIAELETLENVNKDKAETIYANYAEVDSLLKELHSLVKEHGWKTVSEKLKGHEKIKDLDGKKKSFVFSTTS